MLCFKAVMTCCGVVVVVVIVGVVVVSDGEVVGGTSSGVVEPVEAASVLGDIMLRYLASDPVGGCAPGNVGGDDAEDICFGKCGALIAPPLLLAVLSLLPTELVEDPMLDFWLAVLLVAVAAGGVLAEVLGDVVVVALVAGFVLAVFGKAAASAAFRRASISSSSLVFCCCLANRASCAARAFRSCLRCSYSKNLRRSSSFCRFCSSAARRRCSKTCCRRFSMAAFFCNSSGVNDDEVAVEFIVMGVSDRVDEVPQPLVIVVVLEIVGLGFELVGVIVALEDRRHEDEDENVIPAFVLGVAGAFFVEVGFKAEDEEDEDKDLAGDVCVESDVTAFLEDGVVDVALTLVLDGGIAFVFVAALTTLLVLVEGLRLVSSVVEGTVVAIVSSLSSTSSFGFFASCLCCIICSRRSSFSSFSFFSFSFAFCCSR